MHFLPLISLTVLLGAGPDELAEIRKRPELAPLPLLHGLAEFGGGGDRAWLLVTDLEKYQHELRFPLQPGQAGKLNDIINETVKALKGKELETRVERDLYEQTILTLLPKALTPAQVKRFQELHRQCEGPMVLRHDIYARQLRLSDKQLKTIRDLVESNVDDALAMNRAYFVSRRKEEAERWEKSLHSLIWKLDAKIIDELIPAQRKLWIELLGEPYEWRARFDTVGLSPDGKKVAIDGDS